MEQAVEKDIKTIPEPNNNQKECIYNTLEGKYLVLAGPGTGKTFTVTRKIKYMIEQQEVDPSKILCLTFSNTAAREMKTKIGDDYELDIFTYHEFCLNIIEDHSEVFNISDLKVITDSIKRNLIKECIDKKNPKAYNNEKNNPYLFTKDILDGIEEIKKNRLNKEQFFDNIEENPIWQKHLDNLIKQKEASTGDAKQLKKEIKNLTKKIAQMNELWELYEEYNKRMKANDYIDFHDMINAVLEKFEDKESSLIEEIAQKYEYILVDEYQDTNKAQNDIVFNLAKYCKNVFVVGDDDQIIYTFQGANLNTIENYLNNFPDVKVICLTENNRSSQNILDVSQNLAELQNNFYKYMAYKFRRSKKDKELYESNQIDLRICSKEKFKSLNIVKSLTSPKTSPVHNKKNPVEYYVFDNTQDERDYIVATIKNLVNSPDCPEKLSEIAVLTRSNDDIKTFETYLKANGIPTEITGGKNIFDITAVNVFITYLQFLVNPEFYSDKLLSYLLSKPFHIDARDYKTLYGYKSHHRTLLDNINHLIEKGIDENSLKSKLQELIKANSNTLTDDIKNLLDNKDYTIYDRKKLTDFIETYNCLKDYANSESYTNSLLEIGSKTGLFDYYLNQDVNKLENTKGIKKLLDEADSFFATHRNSKDAFLMFVEYLTTMIDSGIKVLLDKEEKPLNAIQLTTYHSSKGREFEYVFMPTLTGSKWESSQGNSDKIPLPSNGLTYEEIQEQQDQNKFLDNIKLLYVGMTRAKHTLILSAIDNGSRTKPSWFISRILDNLKDRPDLISKPEKIEVKGLSDIKTDYDYKAQFEEFIKLRLQKSYSPSSLNTYRKCPRAYFYNYILNLKSDSGNKDNLAYGLAVHKAFQYIIEYTMENKKYPTKDDSYTVFEKAIDKIPCQYPDKLKESGKEQIFDKYFDKFIGIISANNLDSKAELGLNYTIDGINFNGSIDRIDKNSDGTYSIYDYKTGTDESGITKSGVHSDYYYQIAFYKYLFKKQFNINKNVSTCFLYPLIEEPHIHKDISDDECEDIAKEYIELVKNIENMEFDKPPKCPNEKFCNYKYFCKVNAI